VRADLYFPDLYIGTPMTGGWRFVAFCTFSELWKIEVFQSLPTTSLLSQLRCVILVASSAEKPISSTLAMHRCVQSSELLKYRSAHCVPERIARVRHAIIDADWPALAKEICADSDQMHAICADAQPPIRVYYFGRNFKTVFRIIFSSFLTPAIS
jgi:mevalonate pyrophosphate decarboxylase